MTRNFSNAVSLALIGAGALAWAGAGHAVVRNVESDVPLNPLGINRSPYGEVFAMAMQGPIDTVFHRGATDDYGHRHDGNSAGEDRGNLAESKSMQPDAGSGDLRSRFRNFITGMAKASTTRTNKRPASKAHDIYIRRNVEDKLRFAYQLDPSHYGNYNSYHFFLTEPRMGTRPELTPGAAKLADDTIRYCLKESYDPRPALTAAAAACNVLHLLFDDAWQEQPRFTVSQMRQTLALLDHCIARHFELFQKWEADGGKDLLSAMRVLEMEERLGFVIKIRDAAEVTIDRFESTPHATQVSN